MIIIYKIDKSVVRIFFKTAKIINYSLRFFKIEKRKEKNIG